MGSRRLPRAQALTALVAVLVLAAACRGGQDEPPAPATVTLSPTATAAPAATPTPDRLGPPRATAQEARTALQELLAVSNEACPFALVERWSAECAVADFDGDRLTDAAYFVPLATGAARKTGVVMIRRAAAREIEILPARGAADLSRELRPLLTPADRSGDGRPDVTVVTTTCGPIDCRSEVGVFAWDGNVWRDIGPGQPLDNVAGVGFEVRAAERLLIVRTGALKTSAAGPTRGAVQTFVLRDGAYQLSGVVPDPPAYLYHAIRDADERFLAGDFSAAIAGYQSAAGSSTLKDWQQEQGKGDGRQRLRGYALFRLAVATAARGDEPTAAFDSAIRAGIGLWEQAVMAFRTGYLEEGGTRAGCLAAIRYLSQPAVKPFLDEAFDYGYANQPRPAPTDICPL